MGEVDIKLELLDKIRKKIKERIEKIHKEGKPIVHQLYLLSHPACDVCLKTMKDLKEEIDRGDIIVLKVTTELGKKALKDIGSEEIPELVIYVDGKFVKASEFEFVPLESSQRT